MRASRTPIPAAVALALSACSSGFDPQYLVHDVRVLSIDVRVVLDPEPVGSTRADGMPGETLALSALVANPVRREGLVVTWYGCLPVADESLPPCADPAFLADPERLAADPRVLRLGQCTPAGGESAPGGGGECSITAAVPKVQDLPALQDALTFVVSYAEQNPTYQCLLYAEFPVVAVAETVGRRDVALKRVRITPDPATLPADLAGKYVPNFNPPPPLDMVRAAQRDSDGECVSGASIIDKESSFPSGRWVLCAPEADGSLQTFNVCDPYGQPSPRVEELSWQWFTTGGEFPDFNEGIGNATGSAVDFTRPPDAFTLWAILRDGRGGEVWLRRDVLAPP